MAERYYADLIERASDQRRHPYLYSHDDVKVLRDRLAEALDELWRGK